MINIYKTIDGRIVTLKQPEAGCWICAVSPTEDEVAYLINEMKLDTGFVRAALDDEESSRIESEENQTLVIVDVPIAERHDEKTVVYSTMPMSIIITDSFVVTVSLRENSVISEITEGLIKNIQTGLKTRFLLSLLLRIATRYLLYLKQIDKISSFTERQLHKSMKNKELIQLLELEKSLVYFSTSLKSNEMTLQRILRGKIIKLYDEDEDILEDVLIEIKQAIEMCNIYSSILSGMMDAFASIISNNLNIVMKILTCLTIIMAIPTMIFSFYGMNVSYLPLANSWFPISFSVVSVIAATIILVKKGMFK
ncbi:MAG TPA: magnesium transporter [Ruminococcaceae bacterium]|nr:magnesium transporter [Oscillospiraceae bacterium]